MRRHYAIGELVNKQYKGGERMTEKELRLRVQGWRYARRARVENNTLYVEIALASCSHCSICSSRIRTVESRLLGKDTPWRFVHLNSSIHLAVEPKQMPANVGNYMSDLLGFQISEC